MTHTYAQICNLHIIQPLKDKIAKSSVDSLSKELTKLLINAKADIKSAFHTQQTSDKPVMRNWNDIWASKEYGGKITFPQEYQHIKDNMTQKFNYFIILNLLKKKIETEYDDNGINKYEKWWTNLQSSGAPVPKEPPTHSASTQTTTQSKKPKSTAATLPTTQKTTFIKQITLSPQPLQPTQQQEHMNDYNIDIELDNNCNSESDTLSVKDL